MDFLIGLLLARRDHKVQHAHENRQRRRIDFVELARKAERIEHMVVDHKRRGRPSENLQEMASAGPGGSPARASDKKERKFGARVCQRSRGDLQCGFASWGPREGAVTCNRRDIARPSQGACWRL